MERFVQPICQSQIKIADLLCPYAFDKAVKKANKGNNKKAVQEATIRKQYKRQMKVIMILKEVLVRRIY